MLKIRPLLLILSCALAFHVNAQKFSTALQSLLEAERAFANTSKQLNTRTAFLENLHPNGILFAQGQVVNGPELWQERETLNDLLFWDPVFADVSVSGDMGFTTGPFELFFSRTDTLPGAVGYYCSVWKKNEDQIWKVMVDLGVSFSPPLPIKPELSTPAVEKQHMRKVNKETERQKLMELDKNYISNNNNKKKSFNAAYFASTARLLRPRNYPVVNLDNIQRFEENELEFQQEWVGGDLSDAADLGFTYGNTTILIKSNGSSRTVKANYLRIWKRINNEWKILTDVVGL